MTEKQSASADLAKLKISERLQEASTLPHETKILHVLSILEDLLGFITRHMT